MGDLTKKELIELAIKAYIDDFEDNNGPQRNETIKWTAAATFATNWDVEAGDMLSMWKKCTKKAFIDTPHSHPAQGITYLLNTSSEIEGVRQAFKALFAEETGDVDEKWDRILVFMDYINGRLNTLLSNPGFYLQTKESVLTYLNLWDPDHNYRYKPAAANSWASFIGYADWETGQGFSLSKYYKMCDEILEVVKNHADLLQIHSRRFENGEPNYDKEFHILTFDVLYCYWGHKDIVQEGLKEYKEAMIQQQIENLEEQQSEIYQKIEEKTRAIYHPNYSGLKVYHKKYGSGKVTMLEDNRLSVQFENMGPVKFQCPDAFLNGFLQSEDISVIRQLEQNKLIEEELAKLQKEVEGIKGELSELYGIQKS